MTAEVKLSKYCLVSHREWIRGGGPVPDVTPRTLLWRGMLLLDRKMHFTGLRGATWRFLGIDRSVKNPNLCNAWGAHWEVGRLSDVTVLFADARGFTALIHERGPEEITPFIHEFFRRCSNIVVNHDGIIDNFRGDAVLGFFNVPIKRDDHIARAISAAREIQLAVPEINLRMGQEDLLKVGIGITTGMTLATTVGSNDCKDYTVMGDVANIASRLESLAGPGEILVSDEVYKAVQGEYPDARKQELELKGITDPVVAYSLT